MDAFAENVSDQHKQNIWLAYHIEALARQKTLPDYSRLMGEPPKVQTEDEMWAAMDAWVSSHNARFQLAQQLGKA